MAGMVLLGGVVRGQDGSLDLSFNSTDPGYGSGSGANATVYAIARQTDGRLVIGGDLTSYNGTACSRVVRLNTDGSLDAGFAIGSGVNGTVRSIVIQPDGKILLGGDFTTCASIPRNRIARLNANGSLDATFDPGAGADSTVRCMALQSDGKIIIGGAFNSYSGISRGRLARINTTGSLDAAFATGAGANGRIHAVVIQNDGRVIIGGNFNMFNGIVRPHLTRLNTSGNLDGTYPLGSGPQAEVDCLALQPDGKLMVAGFFSSINGVLFDRIARMTINGDVDLTFNPGTGSINHIYSMALQADGKVVIGGDFPYYNGVTRQCIARTNSNGSLDTSFDPGTGTLFEVRALALQPDGKVILGGGFIEYNGVVRGRIARVLTTGTLDLTLNPALGANNPVYAVCPLPDGRVLIGGDFSSYNGGIAGRIAQFLPDGTPDPTFNTGNGASGTVFDIAVRPDGKIMLCGAFQSIDGTPRARIARLHADGTLDLSFDPGTGANAIIHTMDLQPDGKTIIGGDFSTYNGASRDRLARLNENGTLDTTFNAGQVFDDHIRKVLVRPDGTVLVGGKFNSYNSTARQGLVLLNNDGSSVASFNTLTGPNSDVYAIALALDGRILIGGYFTYFGGYARRSIARVNPDGSVDQTFNPGTGASLAVLDIAHQPDGRIVIGGWFTSYNGTARNYLARIHGNGALDTSFDPGTGTDARVVATSLLQNGDILIGGTFDSYNGTGRSHVARVNGTARTATHTLLEGPNSGGTMNDALRTLPSFPLTEPFTAMGYAHPTFTPGATIPSSILSTNGNNAIVDWVLVEMRPASSPGTVAASRAVLLQRDGDVVDLDGVSTVGFAGLADGNYCVAVRSRNHLPVMSSPASPIAYGGAIANLDFTLPTTLVYDDDARKIVSGVMVLAAGDVTFNGTVSYVGSGNDRDPILLRVGGGTPTNTASGYWREDTNLDGVVKYIGAANDRDIILQSIGGIVPSNTRVAGLP